MAHALRLFYLFRLLSTSYLFVPVMALFARSRGLDWAEVGLLNAFYCVTVILTEVPTGALADRFGRRLALMAGALTMVASCATYYVAYDFGTFIVAECLAALSMTLCSGADTAYLYDLLNDRGRSAEYARREGTASAWHHSGNALAYAAGGFLAAVGLGLPYLVTGIIAFAAFFVAVFMREDAASSRPPVTERMTAREYVETMRGAFRYVAGRERLLWGIGYSAVVFVLLRTTNYLYQPYLESAGFSVWQTGLIFALVFLIAALVAYQVDGLRRRFQEMTLLWVLLATLAGTFFLLGSSNGPWALGILALQGAANGLYSPLVKPLLNREIDDSRRRATVLSVESMARRGTFGVVFAGIGALMDSYGTRAGILACGCFGLLGLGALAWAARAAAASASSVPVLKRQETGAEAGPPRR